MAEGFEVTSMNDDVQSQSSSPRPPILYEWIFWVAVWTILGIAFMVIFHLIGWLNEWGVGIHQMLVQPPFLLTHPIVPSSLGLFVITLIATLFFVYLLLGIRHLSARLGVWFMTLLLVALCTPVFALWNLYFNPFGLLVSLFIAGLGSSITAGFLSIHNR